MCCTEIRLHENIHNIPLVFCVTIRDASTLAVLATSMEAKSYVASAITCAKARLVNEACCTSVQTRIADFFRRADFKTQQISLLQSFEPLQLVSHGSEDPSCKKHCLCQAPATPHDTNGEGRCTSDLSKDDSLRCLARCYTILFYTVLYSTLLHYAVLYYTIL